MQFNLEGKKIFVTGHRGMVGSALVRRLEQIDCQIQTIDKASLDLRQQEPVNAWMAKNRPDLVIIAAAQVGGILANQTYPAEFLYNNLCIAANLIHAAKENSVQKLLFLGSSCIYPRDCPQPILEKALLSGPLESSNEWYAIAKIAGLKMVEAYRKQYDCDFISCMPTNLYGPNDNYDLEASHVLPALLRKIHEAKAEQKPVTLWGSGKPKREFLFVDDLADACIHLLQYYSAPETINIGLGTDLSIQALAELIADILGYRGEFIYDTSKPDGTPQKLLDVNRLKALGWQAKTPLREGIENTYQDFLRRFS